MRKDDCVENAGIRSFLRLVYATCIFCVLFLFGVLYQNENFYKSSSSDSRLKSYEELKSQKNNLQVSSEWKFLTQNAMGQKHRRILYLSDSDEEALEVARYKSQVADHVANIAESMRETSTEISSQPVLPLIKMEVMRKHPNQTFEPKNMRELTELEEVPVTNSASDTGEHLKVGKPVEPEPEIQPEKTETSGEEPALMKSESKQDSESQALTPELRKKGELVPEVPPKVESGYQRVQSKVRFCSSKSGSVDEILKFLEEEPEEVPAPEPEITEIQKQKRPYNHKEGLEILRKFNRIARERLESYSREVRDYSLILYKWDTTNSRSDGMDVMYFKLRENPYSIYSFSIFPKRVEGREFLYWEGHYDNQLVVNSGPRQWSRTLMFAPDSSAIRSHSTRSVLELGFRKLLQELIHISSRPEIFKNAEIRYYDQAQVGKRSCYALEVTFPEKTQGKAFFQIRIFVDRELVLPIQIVIYDWPEKGKSPKVLESYTYVIQQMNPGFQDWDFCYLNPQYGFKSYIPNLSEEEIEFMDGIVSRMKQKTE